MIINDEVRNLLKVNAKKAFDLGEIPVSAVIVDSNMNVICSAFNNRQSTSNILGHAEVLCILEAERLIGDWRLNGYSMIVNLEPCVMCSAIISESRLDNVCFMLEKPNLEHYFDIRSEYVEGYDEDKLYFRNLLTDFFEDMR